MEDVGKNLKKIMNRGNYQARYEEMMTQVLADPDVQAFLEENADKLTEEDIVRSYSKLYEFVKESKKISRTRCSDIWRRGDS